jgi:hypothetical protein
MDTMDSWESVLDVRFEMLDDAVDDFMRSASTDNAQTLLRRLVVLFDEGPLESLISSTVPTCDFRSWHERTGGRAFSSGSRALDWPAEIGPRVCLQLQLVRLLSQNDPNPLTFSRRHFLRTGSPKHSDIFRALGEQLLIPLIRDLSRLSNERPIPAVIRDSLRTRPTSDDSVLDDLLEEASNCFMDPSVAQRRRALEKLWDAWERAKTLQGTDKKSSAEALLHTATSDPAFLSVLSTEASTLTSIGNNFHIRHFEANRSDITSPDQVDYLFIRMYALLQLLLRKRQPGEIPNP